jgi:hypothetical protein
MMRGNLKKKKMKRVILLMEMFLKVQMDQSGALKEME